MKRKSSEGERKSSEGERGAESEDIPISQLCLTQFYPLPTLWPDVISNPQAF
jgi:hypothetical protein